jgi:hypothetical protein
MANQVNFGGTGGSQDLLDLGQQLFATHFRAVGS